MSFYVMLNIVSFIIAAAQLFPDVGVTLPWQSAGTLNSLFNIDAFSALTGIVGGVAIGIIGFLLKQGIYATFAVIIFVFGVVFKPISLMFTSLPIALGSFCGDAQYLVTAILAVVSFAAFWFLVELLLQRSVS
jgi:hypothetical protein